MLTAMLEVVARVVCYREIFYLVAHLHIQLLLVLEVVLAQMVVIQARLVLQVWAVVAKETRAVRVTAQEFNLAVRDQYLRVLELLGKVMEAVTALNLVVVVVLLAVAAAVQEQLVAMGKLLHLVMVGQAALVFNPR
jgi:hypothetical protein